MSPTYRSKAAVEEIAKNGDVLDIYYKSKRKVGQTAAVGMLAASGASIPMYDNIYNSSDTSNLVNYMAATAAAIIATRTNFRYRSEKRGLLTERNEFQEIVKNESGEPIDIVATKNGPSIIWETNRTEFDSESDVDKRVLRRRMLSMADYADEVDIKEVIVPATGQVQAVVDSPHNRSTTLSEWFKANKGITAKLDYADEEPVVSLSTFELRKLAESLDIDESTDIDIYLAILAKTNMSRVPTLYEQALDQPGHIETYRRRLVSEIVDSDQETHTIIDRDDNMQPIRSRISTHSTLDSRGNLHRIGVSESNTSENAEYSNHSLLASIGVGSREQLWQQLQTAESYGERTAQAARIALYLEMLARGDSLQTGTKKPEESDTHFQRIAKGESVVQDKTLKDIAIGKSALVLLAVGGVLVAPHVAHHYANSEEVMALSTEYTNTSTAFQESTSYDEYLLEADTPQSLAAWAESRVLSASTAAKDTIDPHRLFNIDKSDVTAKTTGPPKPLTESGISGQIGGVEQRASGKAYPMVILESVNGADTSGYWQQSSLEYMYFSDGTGLTFTDRTPDVLYPDSIPGETIQFTFTPPEKESDTPLISTEIKVEMHPDTIPEDMIEFVPLTIKAGTEPIAAQIIFHEVDGDTTIHEPKFTKNASGEWYFQNSKYYIDKAKQLGLKDITLKYWLKENDEAKLSAQTSVTYVSDKPYAEDNRGDKYVDRYDQPLTDAPLTEEVLGEDTFESIKSKYYSLSPGIDINHDIQDASVDSYVAEIARLDNANCNLATAQLIIAERGTYDGKTINPANGFLNNNGDNVLTNQEAHMWTVDNEGKIIDATPSKMKIETIESNIPTANILKTLGLFTIISTGGAYIYRRRDTIKSTGKIMKAKAIDHSHKRLQKRDSKSDRVLAGKLESSYYANPDARAQPSQSSAIESLRRNLPPLDYKESLERIGKISPVARLRLGRIVLASKYIASEQQRLALKSDF